VGHQVACSLLGHSNLFHSLSFFNLAVEPVVVPQSLVVEAPLNSLITRIACTVEAWPRPNIVWLFEGQPLQDSAKFSTVNLQIILDKLKYKNI
jgi:hypothetical protein